MTYGLQIELGHKPTPPNTKQLKHLAVPRRGTWWRFEAASVPIVCQKKRLLLTRCGLSRLSALRRENLILSPSALAHELRSLTKLRWERWQFAGI